MISAATGGRLKVIGSSIAMVATGPIPGNTPISVPSITPMKQYHRFCRLSATLKPSPRLCISCSIASPPPYRIARSSRLLVPRPQLERQAQPPDEYRHRRNRQPHPQNRRLLPVEGPTRQTTDEHQRNCGHYHPDEIHQQPEHYHRQNNEKKRLHHQRRNRLRVHLADERAHRRERPQRGQYPPQYRRKIRRPHAHRRAHRVVVRDQRKPRTEKYEYQTRVKILLLVELQGQPPFSRCAIVAKRAVIGLYQRPIRGAARDPPADDSFFPFGKPVESSRVSVGSGVRAGQRRTGALRLRLPRRVVAAGAKPESKCGPAMVPSTALPTIPCDRSLMAIKITSSSAVATSVCGASAGM